MSQGPPTPIYLAWSGGKDGALALYYLQQDPRYRVSHLFTTVSEEYGRITMHGIRQSLLRAQAQSMNIELIEVPIPSPCPMEEYGLRMARALATAKDSGIGVVAYGDIFLEDVKAYREERLAAAGMKGLFPLWGGDTKELAREFIDLRFRAYLACIDTENLHPSFAGRVFDQQFLGDLPPKIDPCGENGEFHTFVWDGPIFNHPVPHLVGNVENRGRFHYCEFCPI